MRQLAGLDVHAIRFTGRSHGYRHVEVTLADGTRAFAKLSDGDGDGPAGAATAFAAESSGLRWLAEVGAPVPAVLGVSASALVIALIEDQQPAERSAAFRFGTDLARLHSAGAPSFGASWPGVIANLTLDNTQSDGWRQRVPLHQLHPLLVHVCLFGAGYRARLREAARAALAAG